MARGVGSPADVLLPPLRRRGARSRDGREPARRRFPDSIAVAGCEAQVWRAGARHGRARAWRLVSLLHHADVPFLSDIERRDRDAIDYPYPRARVVPRAPSGSRRAGAHHAATRRQCAARDAYPRPDARPGVGLRDTITPRRRPSSPPTTRSRRRRRSPSIRTRATRSRRATPSASSPTSPSGSAEPSKTFEHRSI